MQSPERQSQSLNDPFDWKCSFCNKEALYSESFKRIKGDIGHKIYYCQDHVERSRFYGGVQNSSKPWKVRHR